MNLFRAELVRFWTRRITWIVLGVTCLILTFGVGVAFTRTSGEPPPEDAVPFIVDEQCVQDFKDGNISFGPGGTEPGEWSDDEIDEFCQRWVGDPDKRFWAVNMLGDRYWFTESNEFSGPDGRIPIETWSDYIEFRETAAPGTMTINGVEYRESQEPLLGWLSGPAVAYLIVAVILGGSFIGAEFRAGTVENLLLWEPRRTRVMLTKFAVGFVSSAAVVAIVLGFFTGLLSLLASMNGTWEAVDGRFWRDVVFVIGRIAVTAGLFAVLAMAVATITRHTAAAIAAVLGWFAVSNIVIELVAKWFRPYELFVNALAFYGKGQPFKYVPTNQGWDFMAYHHGYLAAGLYVAAWTLIPAAIATVIFVKRDLT